MIYVAHLVGTDLHKIGYTCNVASRLMNLRTGCPFEITLRLLIAGGTRAEEAALHRTYADKRVRGEWFVLEDEDILDIEAGWAAPAAETEEAIR